MGVKDVMSRQILISSAMWQTYYPFIAQTLAFLTTKRVVTESFPFTSDVLPPSV